jgi:hypothetical protein
MATTFSSTHKGVKNSATAVLTLMGKFVKRRTTYPAKGRVINPVQAGTDCTRGRQYPTTLRNIDLILVRSKVFLSYRVQQIVFV